jgi:hypothetical protein
MIKSHRFFIPTREASAGSGIEAESGLHIRSEADRMVYFIEESI